MKHRFNRFIAGAAAAALLLSQNGFSGLALAEEPQDQAVVLSSADGEDTAEEELSVENEDTAPEEDADTGETAPKEEEPVDPDPAAPAEEEAVEPTPDPEPVPETEAPATEAQEVTPVTEAPVPEPAAEVPAEQTEAAPAPAETPDVPAADTLDYEEEWEDGADDATDTDDSDSVFIDEEEDDVDFDEDDFDDMDYDEDEDDEEESETEEVETSASFKTEVGGAKVSVRLNGSDSLPEEGTTVTVTMLDENGDGAAYYDALYRAVSRGHRELAGAAIYRLDVSVKDGEAELKNKVEVSFNFDQPLSLGLAPYMEAEAQAWSLGETPEKIDGLELKEETGEEPVLAAASFLVEEGSVFAIAGIENHINKGEELELTDLQETLGDVVSYTVLTDQFLVDQAVPFSETMFLAVPDLAAANLPDLTGGAYFVTNAFPVPASGEEAGADAAASEEEEAAPAEEGGAWVEAEETVPTTAEYETVTPLPADKTLLSGDIIRERMSELSDYSLDLADSKSTDDITVVNVYADEDGFISYAPLEAVLNENGYDLDTTEGHILVNVVAENEEQELELPVFAIQNTDPTLQPEDTWATYGRILYNIVALKDGEFVPYQGKATMTNPVGGTWLAPEGTIVVKQAVVGAVYAGSIIASPTAIFQRLSLSLSKGAPEEENIPEEVPQQADFEHSADEEASIAAAGAEENPAVSAGLPEELENVDTEEALEEEETEPEPSAATQSNADETPAGEEQPTGNEEKKDEESAEQKDGEDEQPDYSNAIHNAKITVNAYLDGTTKAVPNTMEYQLVKKNPNGGLDVLAENIEVTDCVGTINLDTDKVAVFTKEKGTAERVRIYVVPVSRSDGFYYTTQSSVSLIIGRKTNGDVYFQANDGSEITDTSEPGYAGATADPFYYKEVNTKFTIKIETPDTSKKNYIPDVGITLIDGEKGNDVKYAVKDVAGNPMTVTSSKKGTAEFTIDVSDYPAFYNMEPGDTKKLILSETDVPLGYTRVVTLTSGKTINQDRKFYLYKDAYGNAVIGSSSAEVKKNAAAVRNEGKALELDYIFYQKALKVTFTVSAVDKDDKKELPLGGAAYTIRMPDGTLLAGSNGKIHTTGIKQGKSKVAANSYTLNLTSLTKLAKLIKEDGKAELTISELTPPTTNNKGDSASYAIYGNANYKLTLKYNASKGTLEASPSEIKMKNRKISSSTSTSDTIKVTKHIQHKKENIYFNDGDGDSYYVALFSDKDKTKRVSGLRRIELGAGAVSASTTFSNLEAGTYYVGETNQYGDLIQTSTKKKKNGDPYYVTYDADKVVVGNSTTTEYSVDMTNHYFTKPNDSTYYAAIQLQKFLQDKDGNAKTATGRFWYLLRIYNTTTNQYEYLSTTPQSLVLDNSSQSEVRTRYIELEDSKSADISVVEVMVDSNGNVLFGSDGTPTASSNYDVSYSSSYVVVSRSQTSVPLITITNKEKSSSSGSGSGTSGSGSSSGSGSNSSGSTSGSGKIGKGKVTLTKRVTYRGQAQAVNGAYYVGLFKSSDLKKENLLTDSGSVRSIALRNKSEESNASFELDIDALKAKYNITTVYFAETDKDGNPVESGDSTGYSISINGNKGNFYSYTFDANNLNANIVVTNDIIVGGRQETRLLNSSSGFAGDASSLSQAQELAASGVTGSDASSGSGTAAAGSGSGSAATGTGATGTGAAGTTGTASTGSGSAVAPGVASRTGDTSPILPLLAVLGCSAAVIIIALILLRRKRK